MNFNKMKSERRNRNSKKSANDEIEEDEEHKNELNIHSEFNKIYFYEDVSVKSVYTFIKVLNEVAREVMIFNIEYETNVSIHIHIHSDGGDAFAGLGAMDAIKACKGHTITCADGFVASAATFMLLAGDEVRIHKNTTLLIHQMSTSFWGRYEDLKDEMNNSDSIMEIIKNIYTENTSIPQKVIKQLMTREVYINSESAIKWKIADKLI